MFRFPIISRSVIPNRIQNGCFNQISTQSFPLQFKATPILCKEPLKKKKRIDPNLIKFREEKKKKRLEKEIRKLQKLNKELKPIYEFEIPKCLAEEKERRTRKVTVSEEVAEERILLLKYWSKYKLYEYNKNAQEIKRIMDAQKQALLELRLESEELYQAAVQIDESLIPLKFKGPCETPAKEDYIFPDGVYKDVSKKWL